ncbi:MAG: hypothetical protein ACM3QU_00940 [Verrucomicrobiota bacterium]
MVVLGDVVTGTYPAETFDRLLALAAPVRFLRGNADRGRARATRCVLGDARPGVDLLRTDDDVEAAAASVRASGQPNADEVAETLLDPPGPDEATGWWEASRLRG